ncbi:hypothetical protein F4604DRAFT_1900255 [Suillus subluteus]|nr:hypothetical protein F4604DRAFT_1900255 [Suillus subluteus]
MCQPTYSSSGLELINGSSEIPAKLVLVYRLSAYSLKCGPAGNHIANGMSPLEKTNISSISLDPPILILQWTTKQSAPWRRCKTKSSPQNDGECYVLKNNVVPDSPHGPAVEEASQMDYETANWPIQDEFALHVDSIEYNFQATPLPVFYDGNLIQPIHTNTALNCCIVEIEFTVRRWKIQDHDTFQATAENVTTLRLGAVHHNTNHKPRTSTTTTMGRKINKIPRETDASGSKA